MSEIGPAGWFAFGGAVVGYGLAILFSMTDDPSAATIAMFAGMAASSLMLFEI